MGILGSGQKVVLSGMLPMHWHGALKCKVAVNGHTVDDDKAVCWSYWQ